LYGERARNGVVQITTKLEPARRDENGGVDVGDGAAEDTRGGENGGRLQPLWFARTLDIDQDGDLDLWLPGSLVSDATPGRHD
jgi:hypothetical protein